MYKCSHCTEEKPESEYWKRKPTSKWNRPVQSWCKECVRRHKRLESTRDKQRKYNVKWRNENKEHIKKYQDIYKEENLEKIRARGFVKNSIRHHGLRKRQCEVCGDNAQAHHWKGYDKKNYLNIQWLCPTHHYEADNNK